MCAGPDWKREKVPDHKFDFVDTREFTDNSFGMRMKYLLLYALVLKSFLVYISDIFSAITMVTTHNWSNDIFDSCPKSIQDTGGCVAIDFNIGRWIFFGCVIFGFLLVAYEARKSKKIVKSRDISYAFTNVMANHYYSLRSYDHFCFFDRISNSTKKKDDFAFFVFFTFKGWKRLLLADGPRQAINAITLYSFYLSKSGIDSNWYDLSKYFAGRTIVANALTCTIVFTVVVFAISLLNLIAAGVCYIPLLCYIRGNLKEYCCHKVDKRIRDILQRRNKQRQQRAMALAKKEAEGDFSHIKNRGAGAGAGDGPPLPMPTLPNIALDDEDLDDGASFRTRGPAPSTLAGDHYGDKRAEPSYAGSAYHYGGGGAGGGEYPAMPGYDQQQYASYYEPQQPQLHYTDPRQQPQQYADPTAAAAVYGEREPYFHDNYGSVATLPGTHEPYDPQHYAQHESYDHAEYGQQHDPYGHAEYVHAEPDAYAAQDYPSPTSGGPPEWQHTQMPYGDAPAPRHRRGESGTHASGGYAV